MENISRNRHWLPLFFLVMLSFCFFSSMVEGAAPGVSVLNTGAGLDVNVLARFCRTFAKDSRGDIRKLQRSTDCSYYLTVFKTGDRSSSIGIKLLEIYDLISKIIKLFEATLNEKQNNDAGIEYTLAEHHASLLRIDDAYEIYKNNVKMNKMKGQFEPLKKMLQQNVIISLHAEQRGVTSVSDLVNPSARLIEAAKLTKKVVASLEYTHKAICEFGYSPQDLFFCHPNIPSHSPDRRR